MRERTQWEAIDLSIVFIRHFARFIYLDWFLFTFPLAIVLNFVFQGRAIIPILILWYLKPLFERLPLFIASRLFFRQSPRLKNFFRRPLHYILRHLPGDLTYRRFSPWRAYSMPVRFLEELRGERLSRRLAVVTRNGRGSAVILTAVCLVFELGLFFGWILLLVALFMDSKTFNQLLDFSTPMPLWVSSMQFFFYYISLLITEPFYILAGFFLYINRRVYLEGWDIELVFKRLANRLTGRQQTKQQTKQTAVPGKSTGSTTVVLLLVFFIFTAFPGMVAHAEPQANPQASPLPLNQLPIEKQAKTVKEDVRKIMDSEDFKEWDKREWWEWKRKDDAPKKKEGKPNPLMEKLSKLIRLSFGFIARMLPWLLGCGLLLIIALFIIKYRENWRPGFQKNKVKTFYTVRPDGQQTEEFVLPAQILKAAEEAWQRGEHRAALGLIYRGALVYIIFIRKIFLPESATEGECLRFVRQALTVKHPETETVQPHDSSLLADFTFLIGCWQRVAYAHLQIANDTFYGLCERWRSYLTAVDELQSTGSADEKMKGRQGTTEMPAPEQGESV